MPTKNYAVGFNIQLRDGSVFRVNPGKQDVPDEVASNRVAQFNEVDPPAEIVAGYVPPYGTPGHMQHAFLTNQGVEAEDIPTDIYIRQGRSHVQSHGSWGLVEDRSIAVPEGTVQSGEADNTEANLTGEHMAGARGDNTGHDNTAAAEAAKQARLDNEATQKAESKKKAEEELAATAAAREETLRKAREADAEAAKAGDDAIRARGRKPLS